jgi:branched-chain amino acid aminotransferase
MMIYFIPHFYPENSWYEDGVEVGFLEAERLNPEAKVEQISVRKMADVKIAATGFFELLLVDRNNCLTEGSRSNLFLIKNNMLFTAPLQAVLTGVTLNKVLSIAANLNVSVSFESIKYNELTDFDALLLTGTSPKVLPVSKAGHFRFDVQHPLLLRIIEAYDQLVDDDIANRSFS